MMNILEGLGWILLAPIITIGIYTLYVALRFMRRGKGLVDQTAGFLSYFFIMWLVMTRTEEVAHCLPFVKQDLSEMLGFRKDDGEIT